MTCVWPTATIGEVCTVFSGGTPSKGNRDYWHGNIPWVSAKDLKSDRIFDAEFHISEKACDESAAKMAPVGALLVLVRGMGLANGVPIGEITSPVTFNQDIRAIVPPETVVPRFLLLALRHSLSDGDGKGVLSSAAHGTLKIDAEALRQVTFPVPPLREQHRIVAILDEAFEGIATAKANAEKNLLNARELFTNHLRRVFSQRGPTWREAPLLSFALSISTGPFGSLLHKSDYVSEGVPLVNPINIVGGSIVPDPDKLIDIATKHRLQNYVLRDGDVVIGRRGEIGRCAVIGPDEEGWVCGTGCFFIRPRQTVKAAFLAHLIRSGDYRSQLEHASTGTTMKNLSNGALGELVVAIPELCEQNRILTLIDKVSDECRRIEVIYEQKLAGLDELKKSLLHQAFNGAL